MWGTGWGMALQPQGSPGPALTPPPCVTLGFCSLRLSFPRRMRQLGEVTSNVEGSRGL